MTELLFSNHFQTLFPAPDSFQPPSADENPQHKIEVNVVRKILTTAGPLFPTSELTRNRIRGHVVSAATVQGIVKKATEKGLGTFERIKEGDGKGKPCNIFFKILPDEVDEVVLRSFGVEKEYYKQQFFLPLSSTLKVDAKLVKHHASFDSIKEFFGQGGEEIGGT